MLRFMTVGVLATLAACGSAEVIQPSLGHYPVTKERSRPQPGAGLPAGQVARTSDCEAQNPSGLYLVRVGEQPESMVLYAMAWRSRPPTPQAISVSCLLRPREPGPEETRADLPRKDQPIGRPR